MTEHAGCMGNSRNKLNKPLNIAIHKYPCHYRAKTK